MMKKLKTAFKKRDFPDDIFYETFKLVFDFSCLKRFTDMLERQIISVKQGQYGSSSLRSHDRPKDAKLTRLLGAKGSHAEAWIPTSTRKHIGAP